MSRQLSLYEYREYHEDPALDNRIADAMEACACGKDAILDEDGLCSACAEAADDQLGGFMRCFSCHLIKPIKELEGGFCPDCR